MQLEPVHSAGIVEIGVEIFVQFRVLSDTSLPGTQRMPVSDEDTEPFGGHLRRVQSAGAIERTAQKSDVALGVASDERNHDRGLLAALAGRWSRKPTSVVEI